MFTSHAFMTRSCGDATILYKAVVLPFLEQLSVLQPHPHLRYPIYFDMKLHACLILAAASEAFALNVTAGVRNACDRLLAAYPDTVILPTSSNYDAERTNF